MTRHAELITKLPLAFALVLTASCGATNPPSLRASGPALTQPGVAAKPAEQLAFVGHGAGSRRIDASAE